MLFVLLHIMVKKTPSITSDHKVFSDSNGSTIINQGELKLINASPLLISLLYEFHQSPMSLKLTRSQSGNASGGYIVEKGINIKKSGNDFVRLLSHELGHFYDDEKQSSMTRKRKNFTDIINREMDESEATATSFIVRRQIIDAIQTDIGISNRIQIFGPPEQRKILTELDTEFSNRINFSIVADNFWKLAQQIAEKKIWGKNFHTRPRKNTNRWQDALSDAFDDQDQPIPDWLEESVHTFKSAELIGEGNNKKYQFTFQEVGSDLMSKYMYETSTSSSARIERV